jgi:hypothetical protein
MIGDELVSVLGPSRYRIEASSGDEVAEARLRARELAGLD